MSGSSKNCHKISNFTVVRNSFVEIQKDMKKRNFLLIRKTRFYACFVLLSLRLRPSERKTWKERESKRERERERERGDFNLDKLRSLLPLLLTSI